MEVNGVNQMFGFRHSSKYLFFLCVQQKNVNLYSFETSSE